MTHRARLVTGIAGTVIVLALLINIVAGKVAAPAAADTGRQVSGVAPVYVPRPLALQYGRSLTDQSSAIDVATAFVVVYYNADPSKSTAADQFSTLPRVAESAGPEIRAQLETDWKSWGSEGGRSTLPDPAGITSQVVSDDQAGTTVQLSFQQTLADTTGNVRTVAGTATVKLVSSTAGYEITAFRHQ